MLTLRTLDKTPYIDLRFQLIKQVEEKNKIRLKPYFDAKGIPTIGMGMNLRDGASEAVMDQILGNIENAGDQSTEQNYRNEISTAVKKSYPKTKDGLVTLQATLNSIMARRATDYRITFPNKKLTFTFDNDAEVKTVFDTISENYEEKIDSWYGSELGKSYERLALFSLAYNQDDSKPLLGFGLLAAMQSGNRPEAWYQIRYQSNGDHLAGTPARRYYESQIFGLYDNQATTSASITEAEAKSVFATYTNHRNTITSYDQNHESSSVTVNGIAEFVPAIAQVQTFDAAISPAFLHLEIIGGAGYIDAMIAADSSSIGIDNNVGRVNPRAQFQTENRRFGDQLFFVKKYLARVIKIASLVTVLLASNFAAAQNSQIPEQPKNAESSDEYSKVKIAIEKLRKKYPISLLDKKKKTYKTGQKINIDDYSIAEIKAAFLNADQNFVSRKKVKGRGIKIGEEGIWVDEEVSVKNQQELAIIGMACDKIRRSDWSKLNKKWKNLFGFIFSDDLPISYYTIKYVSREEAGFCLDSVEEARGL